MTHICISKIIIIGSDSGLSCSRSQAIIWTNTGILLIGPLGINFSEILLNIFSFKKMHLKMSAKCHLFHLGLLKSSFRTHSCVWYVEHFLYCCHQLNTLRPRQNRRHFADNIFKCIFLNENVWISINISLKFVPKGPIDHIPALVQIMAWRRPGAKPLSEPMMVILLTHICVTQPQWVNTVGSHWRSVNIGSGNVLMSSGNKSFDYLNHWLNPMTPYRVTTGQWND